MTSLHPMLTVGRQLTEHVRSTWAVAHGRERPAVELLDTVRPDPEHVLTSFRISSRWERQRIAIAARWPADRSCLSPTNDDGARRDRAGRDPSAARRLRRERDLAVLMISHDLGVMSALADTLPSVRRTRSRVGSGWSTAGEPTHPTLAACSTPARPDDRGSDMRVIRGGRPAGTSPLGCAFAPRCAFAEPRCTEAVPQLTDLGGSRSSACVVDPFVTPRVRDAQMRAST